MKQSLEITNLVIGYQHELIAEINLSAGANGLIALIGRNGKGKSTLLKTISGAIPALSGSVNYQGETINDWEVSDRAKIISSVSTQENIIRNISAKDYIAFGRYPYTNWLGMNTDDDLHKINEAITFCKVEDLASKPYDQLSDGERQRINIARAIAQDTPIILLDEPTAHLDLIQRLEVLKLLKHLADEKKKLILYSTHNVEHAMQLADEIWLINEQVKPFKPQDLAINSEFRSLFTSSHVDFDATSMSFKFKQD